MKIKVVHFLALVILAYWLIVSFDDFIWFFSPESPQPMQLLTPEQRAEMSGHTLAATPWIVISVFVALGVVIGGFILVCTVLDTEIYNTKGKNDR